MIGIDELNSLREYVQYSLETSDDTFRDKMISALDEHIALREQLEEVSQTLEDMEQLRSALNGA